MLDVMFSVVLASVLPTSCVHTSLHFSCVHVPFVAASLPPVCQSCTFIQCSLFVLVDIFSLFFKFFFVGISESLKKERENYLSPHPLRSSWQLDILFVIFRKQNFFFLKKDLRNVRILKEGKRKLRKKVDQIWVEFRFFFSDLSSQTKRCCVLWPIQNNRSWPSAQSPDLPTILPC